MGNAPDWLLILTGLGGGVLGAIITTNGAQTKERRQARATAREALRQAEAICLRQHPGNEVTRAFDELETAAMLAGLPRTLINVHRRARERELQMHSWLQYSQQPQVGEEGDFTDEEIERHGGAEPAGSPSYSTLISQSITGNSSKPTRFRTTNTRTGKRKSQK
jgi:hypothetical protein